MKRVTGFFLFILFLMIGIPLIISGGVREDTKLPYYISKIQQFVPEPLKKPQVEDKLKEEKSDKSIKIKVFIEGQNKIVELELEDYIRGVVAAEMPAAFDIEALKAQAIAARTFAFANLIQNGGSGCAKHSGADVCSTVHCQAYVTKEERFRNWPASMANEYWNKLTQAVLETKGMVITYNNEVARHIKYHSTSNGKTENSIYVFGYQEPYLVSVESPYEEGTPSFSSKVVMKKQEFIRRIKELNPEVSISSNNLAKQIKILEWTEGDRVKTIKIGNKTFSGIDIRWAMGLKSASFTINIDSKNVTFNVKGYGHGVGMSQWGANEMAKRGKKYDEILKHYYKGIEIKKIDELVNKKQ